MIKARRCKDCEPGSRRPAPHPGPRCATHDREKRKRDKAAAHALHIERTYGLTAEQYDQLYAHQGERCAICQRATGKTRKLSVDHDHATGLVRGLLCRLCNKMLGHARDDLDFFERAYCYLEDPPAAQVGIEATQGVRA